MNSNFYIGKLYKIDNDWVIKYNIRLGENVMQSKTIPVHPEDALYCLDSDEGLSFDFEIIDEFSHPEKYKNVGLYDGTIYAKLIGIRNKEDYLYSKIEHLIIEWNINGSKTAGDLTRKIMEIIK
jgi:hypothetical protein